MKRHIESFEFQEKKVGEIIKVLLKVEEEGDRVIDADTSVLLEAPTGAGKTYMLGRVLHDMANEFPKNVCWFWFCPFETLAKQTVDQLTSMGLSAKFIRSPLELPSQDDFAIQAGEFPNVMVFTWASVAVAVAASRSLRSGVEGVSIDSFIRALRSHGISIGAVVDECHHSLGKKSEKEWNQSLSFLAGGGDWEGLRPDMTILASATPDDKVAQEVAVQLGSRKIVPVRVSREDVFDVRLIKEKAYFETLSNSKAKADEKIIPVERIALARALRKHAEVKCMATSLGLPTPLLLIQASNGKKSIEDARTMLEEVSKNLHGKWLKSKDEKEIALANYVLIDSKNDSEKIQTHSSDEPNENILKIASDERVEALVFKMAVATGFDAPRASILVSLRNISDEDFGLQILGRIMRVHKLVRPLLQALLPSKKERLEAKDSTWAETALEGRRLAAKKRLLDAGIEEAEFIELFNNGHIFIASSDSQKGLIDAGKRINILHEKTQAVLGESTVVQIRIINGDGEIESEKVFSNSENPPQKIYKNPNLNIPVFYRQQVCIEDDDASKIALAKEIAEELGLHIPRGNGDKNQRSAMLRETGNEATGTFSVERRNVFSSTRVYSEGEKENVAFDHQLARKAADDLIRSLARSHDHEDDRFRVDGEHGLKAQLIRTLAEGLQHSEGFDPSCLSDKQRSDLATRVNRIISRLPQHLRDAVRKTFEKYKRIVECEPLPEFIESVSERDEVAKCVWIEDGRGSVFERSLLDSDLENDFVSMLHDETVEWWLKNEEEKPWAVCLVRPNGRLFWPDFIVKFTGRRHPILVETKGEHLLGNKEMDKLETEHPYYGKPVWLSKEKEGKRLMHVKLDASGVARFNLEIQSVSQLFDLAEQKK